MLGEQKEESTLCILTEVQRKRAVVPPQWGLAANTEVNQNGWGDMCGGGEESGDRESGRRVETQARA